MKETWWLEAGAEKRLAALGLLSVPACMASASGGRTLSTDRQSAAVLLPDGDPPLLLKWRRPRPGRRLRTALRASRERKEARAMLRATRLGIAAPMPLAVAERRGHAELVGAVLIRPFLTEFEPAEGILQGEDGPAAQPILAGALGRWHALGFRHGDCYPKNALLDAHRSELIPIGCPQASFRRPGPAPDHARLKDLAQWASGLLALDPDSDPFAFLPAYADAAGMPGAEWLVGVVRPLFARIQEKKRRRVATRPAREPHGPPLPTPLPQDEQPVPTRRIAIESLLRGSRQPQERQNRD